MEEKGVGEPLPGVELMIIDPENGESMPQGKNGEICISGPNVFSGYLGSRVDPFLFKNEKKWYRSGDRGYLNKNGSLVLTGRLTRFVKIGGEMISLGGLEEEIKQLAKEKGWISSSSLPTPGFALCSIEREGKKVALVLYTIYNIDKEILNGELKNLGNSNLMRVSEVHILSQIPLTATGKTNYRLLEESYGIA